jgi:hypothetical protein
VSRIKRGRNNVVSIPLGNKAHKFFEENSMNMNFKILRLFDDLWLLVNGKGELAFCQIVRYSVEGGFGKFRLVGSGGNQIFMMAVVIMQRMGIPGFPALCSNENFREEDLPPELVAAFREEALRKKQGRQSRWSSFEEA